MNSPLKKILAVLLVFSLWATHAIAQSADDNANQHPPLIGTLNGTDLVALAVVILGIGAIIVAVVLRLVFRHRNEQELHHTVRMMLDKGVPIPPEMFKKTSPIAGMFQQTSQGAPVVDRWARRPRNDLRNGLLFIGIGLGCIILAGKAGFIILFLGIAFVIASALEKNDRGGSQPPLP